ncbi:tRNA (adenosine(37)-N6)-threonylcarbamoyltransferase complex ATPase subunit type 1 TsaE [candidate division KSB1 bacterium]|nr:tRNA (adenosine(37)-N6)-threonylcarbamoyltransferase complex ATPase subunit type 1 TsaE [candidate division KSB1 bacterium]
MASFFELKSTSAEKTHQLGKRLAKILQPGEIVALTGNLGSGKTLLIQGICAGLEVLDPVTSPTFTLVQEYTGRVGVFHFDFYRLQSQAEIEDLGLGYYFEAGGVSLIEWSEKGRDLIPKEAIYIELQRVKDEGMPRESERMIRITDPLNRPLLDILS